MGLLQSNATVTCLRNTAAQFTAKAYIAPAGPMNLNMDGIQATYDILVDLTGSWQVNDVLQVTTDTPFGITEYVVMSVRPPRGIPRLQVWKLTARGVIR